ncbi:transposase domain-containing protein [Streptomyces noursei]|uniref:transposase domain-containing protein n=1 Tax=Streptomyces noursei TaxID=1971 RepID=UPI0023B85EF2|nr:transposase domain-containing protein [Streptomyces noursei]
MYAPGHLGELTRIVDFDLVDLVLQETGAREKRLRLLPARVVVCFTSHSPSSSAAPTGRCGASSPPLSAR